ncbi:hypothetical protein EZS27_038620 [termite gut metagenome]|uniref:Uncharacterized protein n=1 Tax=termite gut metagenome TaxID=433724 RepID=A0A5J4PKN5_9ZZZZ
MKQIYLLIAIAAISIGANAQEKPSTGDLYDGFTRIITYDRMILPHGLEVSFDKTVHVIFPSAMLI